MKYVMVAVLIAGFLAARAWSRGRSSQSDPVASFLAEYAITLKVGAYDVPPSLGAYPEILKALRADQAFRRLAGLPDRLTPGVLDEEKVLTFLETLAAQPAAVKEPLRGRTLCLLANPGFSLDALSPVTPEALRAATDWVWVYDTSPHREGFVIGGIRVETDRSLLDQRTREAQARAADPSLTPHQKLALWMALRQLTGDHSSDRPAELRNIAPWFGIP